MCKNLHSTYSKKNYGLFTIRVSNKKPDFLYPLLLVVFAVLALTPLFYIAKGLYEKRVEQKQTQNLIQPSKGILGIKARKESQGFPLRLIVPAINVNARISYVGVTPEGEMEVPGNTVDVGWFKLGPLPGERGSAVIAGHLNGKNGEAGVFTNLYKLKEGDRLYIENDSGTFVTFVVRESRTMDVGYASDVFSRNDNAYLNLITCDGVWDEAKKSYSKRLVVFADITQ